MVHSAYIKSIRLVNIRAFKDLVLDFTSQQGSLNLQHVIIGRNGTCKSTLLRCIAMAMASETDSHALLAEFGGRLVSESSGNASISIVLIDSLENEIGTVTLRLRNSKGVDTLEERNLTVSDSDFFVCGYGPNRGITGNSPRRKYRVLDSVATLYNYRNSLLDVELTLRRLEDYMGEVRYTAAKEGIKRILGLDENHSIQYQKGGGITISGPGTGKDISLEGWADGYRMTFNWLIDLYGWAMHAETITPSGGIKGVLLIDEIDQNLHPSMQSSLLNDLSSALPQMQIIATSHSPLTALGMKSENLISLKRNMNSVESVPVHSLSGYSSDDALVDKTLFNTEPYPQAVIC